MTLFYDAVVKNDLDAVLACIKRGDDVNEPTLTENGGYDYPLNLAVSKNLYEIAKKLVEYGAWINLNDDLDHKPIDYAKKNSNRALIDLIEQRKHQIRPTTPEKPLNRLFLSAVKSGDIARASELYSQVSGNKNTMIEASTILIENIYAENLTSASISRWQSLANLFAENRHYLDHLALQQYQYTVNPALSWLKVGTITRLCLNGQKDILFSFLAAIDDLDHHPALIAGKFFLNALQLAIIYSPEENTLLLVRELIEKFNVSTQFSNNPIQSMLEICTKKTPEMITPCQSNESTTELFKKWNTINSALKLAINTRRNHLQLITYLADRASDLELIEAAAYSLNHKVIMNRLVPAGPPNSTTKVFTNKKDADMETIKMMPEIILHRPETLHSDIISTIECVKQTQRLPYPTKPTFIFYLSNRNDINDEDIALIEIAKLLLKKIEERGIHLLPDELLRTYFDKQIISGRQHTDVDTATKHFLSAQIIYTMIKKQTISDFGKMLGIYSYKAEQMRAMPEAGNPSHQLAAAGQLIKYACMFQWSSNEIDEFVEKPIYQAIMEKLKPAELRAETLSQLGLFGFRMGLGYYLEPAIVNTYSPRLLSSNQS